jgi:peptide/nickel transport system permease protein
MIRFALRKLLYSFTVIIGVAVVVFLLFNALPADPARMTAGQRTDVSSLEAINREFGLDKPLPARFALYINDLSPVSFHEDSPENAEKYGYLRLIRMGGNAMVLKVPYLRRSYQSKKEVSAILAEALPGTFVLAFAAMAFATVFGIMLGVLAAINRKNYIDSALQFLSNIGISLPSFFAGIIIAWIFGFVYTSVTGLSMTGSLYDYDIEQGPVLKLRNLILPAFALGIRPLSIITQLTRSSMLDVLTQDYIRTAYAKGLSYPRIIIKHALRNAMNPVVTSISGWFASLMAGAFFIEYIFSWKGIGSVTVDALEKSDMPVIMGSVLFVSAFFVLINIAVDILYVLLDPRVKQA